MRILILSFFLTNLSFAHFKIGTYKGVYKSDQRECEFTIESVSFKNDLKHPLNEKVFINIPELGNQLTFVHLAQVDSKNSLVRPKSGILTHVSAFDLGTTKGALGVELFMNDNGPYELITSYDFYKYPERNQNSSCINLKFIK